MNKMPGLAEETFSRTFLRLSLSLTSAALETLLSPQPGKYKNTARLRAV